MGNHDKHTAEEQKRQPSLGLPKYSALLPQCAPRLNEKEEIEGRQLPLNRPEPFPAYGQRMFIIIRRCYCIRKIIIKKKHVREKWIHQGNKSMKL